MMFVIEDEICLFHAKRVTFSNLVYEFHESTDFVEEVFFELLLGLTICSYCLSRNVLLML